MFVRIARGAVCVMDTIRDHPTCKHHVKEHSKITNHCKRKNSQSHVT